jgi:hypothetical protein
MTVVPIKFRRRPFPIPDTMILISETFGLPFGPVWEECGYTLTRRREGTEVGLMHGGHWWNLSYLTGTYPPGFAAARRWVNGYAAQHGQEVHEMRYDRRIHHYVRVPKGNHDGLA